LNSNPPVVAVVPLTSTRRDWPTHVEIEPDAAGLAITSYAKCEDMRAVSPNRFEARLGVVDSLVMLRVESILRRLLAL
jgi:mRNA interferase MazF